MGSVAELALRKSVEGHYRGLPWMAYMREKGIVSKWVSRSRWGVFKEPRAAWAAIEEARGAAVQSKRAANEGGLENFLTRTREVESETTSAGFL
ncbi:hypothetical protein GOP47_0025898 [Adiantum capillus-veneris]|uniref:Uncharacterized protein n=1 Tax=Adiantum capillus-veneris TaxID=13818 RepID=A0A9D4U348_ADICA|nr:hypothetical protein GOP47_0025898 [Adiantum capillus-veneris]